MTSKMVQGAGVRLRCRVAGESGHAILFLHGYPETSLAWERQLPFFAAHGFRAVAPDLRGYGGSDRPREVRSYTIDLLVADVRGIIEALGGGPVILVGHDWGGLLAWHVAHRHPELLSHLAILNCPHPGWFARIKQYPRQWLRSWYILFFQIPVLPELIGRVGGEALLRSMLAREAIRPDAFSPEQLRSYEEHANDPGPAINYYRAWIRSKPWRARFGPLPVPTLVLWGDCDAHILRELAAPDPAWVPRCTVRHADASHWVQNDAPEWVNAEIEQFLRDPISPPLH